MKDITFSEAICKYLQYRVYLFMPEQSPDYLAITTTTVSNKVLFSTKNQNSEKLTEVV